MRRIRPLLLALAFVLAPGLAFAKPATYILHTPGVV